MNFEQIADRIASLFRIEREILRHRIDAYTDNELSPSQLDNLTNMVVDRLKQGKANAEEAE